MVVAQEKELPRAHTRMACHLIGGLSLLGLVLAAMPAQANASTLNTDTVFAVESERFHTTQHIKPEHTDKSTLRFEQARFEQQRLEQADLAQTQTRLEQLRARLMSPPRATETAATPASGTYLYGQQPIANQPETAYFVFEAQGVDVVGALYMPSSSFDCVRGQMTPQQIALNVTDSYSQETFSYALRLNNSLVEVASQSGSVIAPPNIDGFYPLPVQESDRKLLATCQAI